MKVDWIAAKKEDTGRLGVVPALVLQAKQLLFSWKSLSGATAPISDYGTLTDLTSYWSARDQAMMDGFVDWWTAKGGQPQAFKQLPADTPTQGQVNALLAWAASQANPTKPIEPAQFPTQFPTGQIPPLLPGFILAPTGWPMGVPYPPPKPSWWPPGLQYPPIGDAWPTTAPSWWTGASSSGQLPPWPPPAPPQWPATFPWPIPPASMTNLLTCEQLCDAQFGQKGTTPDFHAVNPCKDACGAFKLPSHQLLPSGNQPGGGATTTTEPAKSSNTGLLVVGGLALLGLGALFFMRGGAAAMMLQENVHVGADVDASLGRRRKRRKKRRRRR